jgi:hypothetical protein
MNGRQTFASAEVARQRMRDHFPCAGRREAIVRFSCSCGTAMLHICEDCGECLAYSVCPKDAWCEHAEALHRATDGNRRSARIVNGKIVVGTRGRAR